MRRLKIKLMEKNLTVSLAAEMIDISKSAFYRKIKRPETFTIGEVIELKRLLRLSNEEAIEIFLGGNRNEGV